ncbi:MAG TPA: TolC family protein, partial [Verrucomicrobiae bacterium]|nr:TolC family protein [Verrucomicrobiae bacterium]
PYPAYGTPAPDVAALRPIAGMPTSVTLAQAVDIAVAQSPAFAAERAQYDAIRAKYSSELQAIFPSISASGSVTRSFGSGASSNSNSNPTPTPGNNNQNLGNAPTTAERASISLQQLIFDGGRVIAAIKSAKESSIAGRDTLLRDLQTLQFDVAKSYYGVLQSNATVVADAELVREFEAEEANVNAEIRAGAAAKSDLASAEFQSAKARGGVVSAQGAAIAAQSAFAATLGLDADAEVVPQPLSAGDQGATQPTQTYAKSLAQALLLRPDYQAAQHTANSAADDLRYAKLARFPSISANASDGVSRTLPIDNSFAHSSSIGATISIPIYDQGLTTYNIAQAKSSLDQANAALTESKLGVESDVRSSLSGLISAEALLVQANLELSSAQVALNAARAKYKVGAATIIDLVTAEANLSQAQTDEITAVYNVQTALQTYNYAVGLSTLQL